MLNISLKKALILSFSALSFSANAYNDVSKENLAQQCEELSRTIVSLIEHQDKITCVEKLSLASNQIQFAGNLILKNEYADAKYKLYDAIYTLQFAELNSCNHYIQISHSKFEAQKIKNSF